MKRIVVKCSRDTSGRHLSILNSSILAIVILSLSSCAPKTVVTRIPADYARLKATVTAYSYACRELNRPPISVEELWPILESAKVDDPVSYLTSTRDGQPYVIIWGLDLGGRHLGSNAPLAYEELGKEGKRLLVTCNQEVKELSEAEFTEIEWPSGHEPKSQPYDQQIKE